MMLLLKLIGLVFMLAGFFAVSAIIGMLVIGFVAYVDPDVGTDLIVRYTQLWGTVLDNEKE